MTRITNKKFVKVTEVYACFLIITTMLVVK